MKVLYFYQYFSTPKGSWGTRVYEFASEWVKQGHEVTVVTSVYSKSDISSSGIVEDLDFNGIKVKALNILIDNKQSKLKRIWSFIRYAVLSSYYALTLDADVVVASSGPITVGIPGLLARYARKRPLVFETRDLWPDGAIELGVINNRGIIAVARWFEKICYQASSLIVALSPGMKKYIEEKSGHDNVISVTNAANIKLFSSKKSLREDFPFLPRKYAVYTGNIGDVNNSWWLLKAAEELRKKGREDIHILLIGEGQQREEIEVRAKELGLSNFHRWGLMPKENLVPIVQNALASLVPLKGKPVLDTSSPNKFFESLAAGVPIIQNTQGWMKDFLAEHEVGFTLSPDDPEELAATLISMDGEQSGSVEMSERAKQLAAEQFSHSVLADKMIHAISGVAR